MYRKACLDHSKALGRSGVKELLGGAVHDAAGREVHPEVLPWGRGMGAVEGREAIEEKSEGKV